MVFTRHVYRPGRPDEGAALVRNSPELAGVSGLAVGTWDAEVCDELGCGPEDLVVDKVRFDAFQWTSLEPLLRGLGVNALMICGVVTNICVETTARSAFMRDFPVTLLADCCAAKTRRLHELSIEVLSSYELAEIASVTDGFDAGDPLRHRGPPPVPGVRLRLSRRPADRPAASGRATDRETRSAAPSAPTATSRASRRQPSRNRPRKASATTMNAAAVP